MTDARSLPRIALLEDRGVVTVAGEDARKLLQGVITNDMDLLDRQPAMLAGLLSPQGKVLFEFIVVRPPRLGPGAASDVFLLDTARDRSAELARRLSLYRLRAKAEIEDQGETATVVALWGAEPGVLAAIPPPSHEMAPSHYPDPRSPELGVRWINHRASAGSAIGGAVRGGAAVLATAAEYHAHRIGLGIPEGGKDYDLGDAFPHEAGLDLCHGVSFDKGCYVGQEIVARMQHRGTVRKRVARVTGDRDLPASRPEVKLGDVVIGRLGSVAARQGLAMLRLDRAIEALDRQQAITAEGIVLQVDPAMIASQRALMAAKAAPP